MQEDAKVSTPEPKKVLIMDDEEIIRDCLNFLLDELGYEVEFAEDGISAVQQYTSAFESGKPYDAVILDLTIPNGTGAEETIEKLLRIDPNVRAIISSGDSQHEVVVRFRDYGFQEVLAKPMRFETVETVLARLFSN